MKKLLIPFLLVGLALGCKDNQVDPNTQINNQVQPRTIFSFTLPESYSGTDAWIILRDDATGELVDQQQFGTKSTLTFTSSKIFSTNKLVVALLRPTNWYSTSSLTLDVYRGIDVGSVWSLKSDNYPILNTGKSMGHSLVTVTDMPANYFATSTNEIGGTNGQARSATEWTGSQDVTETGKNKVLVAAGGLPGDPKYFWLNNSTAATTKLSFNDPTFKAFDKNITLSFPPTKDIITEVRAYDISQQKEFGYALHFVPVNPAQTTGQLTIGFLDEFKKYTTNIKVAGFRFQSDGVAPTEITYVAPDGYTTSVGSPNNVNDYAITTSKDYLYSKTSYEWSDNSGAGFYANFYASKGTTTRLDPLTADLVIRYSIDVSKWKYLDTDFIVKGRTYNTYLDSRFNSAYYSVPQSFEESIVEVQ